MAERKRILVEGWRFSPTSLAVLNQCQCLELVKRPEVELYFKDVPFWTPTWTHVRGLLPPDDERAMGEMKEPPPGLAMDASLRIAHPTLVQKTEAQRSWCWIITEYGTLEQSRIADGRPVREALNTPGVRLITCSRWSRDGLVRVGADPANVAMVSLGYEPRWHKPAPPEARAMLRRQAGWEGKFVFLNISTMWWNKGVAVLLQSFAATAEKHPDVLLVLKGNNRTMESNEFLMQSLAGLPAAKQELVRARLRYIGEYMTFEQIAMLYQAADCYVAPYHGEGFNLPVLEASACGLASICTAGGPTDDFTAPEFCRRIEAEAVSPPGIEQRMGPGARLLQVNGDHLNTLMREMVTDEAYRARAREAGPAFVYPRFTWETIAGELVRTLVAD